MKLLNLLLVLAFVLSLAITAKGQNVVSSTSSVGVEVVSLSLGANVKLDTVFTVSSSTKIRWEAVPSVSATGLSPDMADKILSALNRAGRYTAEVKEGGNTLFISFPGMEKRVESATYGSLNTELKIRIFVPQGTEVLVN